MATQVMDGSVAQVQERLKTLDLQPEQRIRLSWDDNTTPSEDTLLAQIGIDFSESFWKRFAELYKHLEPDTFTEEEREEFLAMNDELELRNAARMKVLVSLAQKRGRTLPEIMHELQIRHLQIPDSID